jgi:hypothetical protein
MLTCKEASRLNSEELDRKLGVGEWLTLRMHLAVCRGCSRVNAQFQFLRRAVSQLRDSPSGREGIDRN